MKQTTFLYILILVLSSSCANLNISEIKNLEKAKFDSLRLRPDREINNLRIDLIRQTYEESINDSIKETKDTPYHPIGFDLENGLFYDLNKNLCLRIDFLLDFSSNKDFELQKINNPEKHREIIIYRFNNDTLTTTYPPRKKAHYDYHQIKHLDSVSYMFKNRMKFKFIL